MPYKPHKILILDAVIPFTKINILTSLLDISLWLKIVDHSSS